MFESIDWNDYAACYDMLNRLAPYRALMCEVATALASKDSSTLLDAGCGTGNLTALLYERYPGACIFGVDASAAMLARARQKSPGTSFVSGDLDDPLPFDYKVFDGIACVNALYAVHDPAYTLASLRQKLRPGGVLVIATPKANYENGLILKTHCRSEKPDSYWMNAHAGPEREKALLHEALGDERVTHAMSALAAFNRRIARTARYHFFTEDSLRTLIHGAGLRITTHRSTYAGQSHFIVAKRPKEDAS